MINKAFEVWLEFANLKDFISNIELEKIEGIIDMQTHTEDIGKREFYLDRAIDILKEMVDFHIEAATRKRYEKAPYYCSTMMDIYSFLKKH